MCVNLSVIYSLLLNTILIDTTINKSIIINFLSLFIYLFCLTIFLLNYILLLANIIIIIISIIIIIVSLERTATILRCLAE